jgi:hypothetical protein
MELTMRRSRRADFALLCAALAFASPARAGLAVPDQRYCVLPAVLPACPAGDIAYMVTILDNTQSPLYDVDVTLNFSACPGFQLCVPGPGTQYTLVPPASVQVSTDQHGQAVFWVEGEGTCSSGVQVTAGLRGGPVVLLTDGVYHLPVSVAGVDQDGNGVVTTWDQFVLNLKGASDPTADVNGDGVHDATDYAIIGAHLGHPCPALVTPNQRRTWGGLKLIYR